MQLIHTQTLVMACCDDFFEKMLCGFTCGKIHSVFSNTVNLLVDKGIYAVVSGKSYLAPYTSNTEQSVNFKGLRLTQGADIAVDTNRLYLSQGTMLDLTRRKTFCLSRNSYPFHRPTLQEAIRIFDRYVGERDVNKGCMRYYLRRYLNRQPEAEFIGDMVDRRIDQWLLYMPLGKIGFYELEKLIGAGNGLTPAGDDFFCGFFAALDGVEHGQATKKAEDLRDYLLHRLDKLGTTDISRQMLRAHLAGLLPSPYSRLKQAFLHKPQDIPPAMKGMEAIGHSSGMDFAAGMAAALHFILENYG